MTKVTIWGLKHTRHSHRFIHKGFYENFAKLGYETNWVEDKPTNQELESDIYFVSGVASDFIKFKKASIYILHNVKLNDRNLDEIQRNKVKYINLQVYTNDSKGEEIDNKNTLYDPHSNTIFQPWGTPLNPSEWSEYSPKNKSRIEWWVGAVWNNSLNQGNVSTITQYKTLLQKKGVLFLKRGGSRFRVEGVSDSRNSKLIRNSRIGATIVGSWQQDNNYIPCRLFKNISFGIPPTSNMSMPKSFTNTSGFIKDLEQLIDFSLHENESSRQERFNSARQILKTFTYSNNITRILNVLAGK
jgi:hypothetical protein